MLGVSVFLVLAPVSVSWPPIISNAVFFWREGGEVRKEGKGDPGEEGGSNVEFS